MTDAHQRTSTFHLTIKRYLWVIIIVWTAIVSASLLWNISEIRNRTFNEAYTRAKIAFNKDILYRKWAARHGGLYVPATPETPPNPYLSHIPERDITTPSGRKLTLVNPAYMTRQVYELELKEYGNLGHLTSLEPIRPGNAPDMWERKALGDLRGGKKEFHSVENIEGKGYFRFMSPFFVENSCLKCHGQQGYKTGELRGGISISINIEPLLAGADMRMRNVALSHILLWGAGLAIILFGYKKLWGSEQTRIRVEIEREKLISELQDSLSRIKTLSGLLPICASCKKIRNDEGYWEQIEKYVGERSTAEFSHGICPDCEKILYPELFKGK